jgi:hypothetical protein
MSDSHFIMVWQTSKTVAEVSRGTGLSEARVRDRWADLVGEGVPLRALPGLHGNEKVRELAAAAVRFAGRGEPPPERGRVRTIIMTRFVTVRGTEGPPRELRPGQRLRVMAQVGSRRWTRMGWVELPVGSWEERPDLKGDLFAAAWGQSETVAEVVRRTGWSERAVLRLARAFDAAGYPLKPLRGPGGGWPGWGLQCRCLDGWYPIRTYRTHETALRDLDGLEGRVVRLNG